MKQMASPAQGLAFERRLFDAEGPQVGLWSARQPGLVCPAAYARRAGFDIAAQGSAARDWPVHLRPTGGGTVPQGPGIDNLVLAFNAPPGATIEDVYKMLIRIIQTGIGAPGASLLPGHTPGSFCDGAWNLSADGQKIVGTAQRWRPNRARRPRVMAHALILTRHRFGPGAEAVARFHADMGLGAVLPGAHTSLEAAFGLTDLPAVALASAARNELAACHCA